MTIKLRSLYKETRDGEELNCIIAYNKIPNLITTKIVEPDPYFTSTETHYKFVNQYRKRIYIDLWLFTINHTWLTKYID
jgi:hypothetical protein